MSELSNEAKIRFCNAFHALNFHARGRYCYQCCVYLDSGDGDLCERSKEIIAAQLSGTADDMLALGRGE